MENIRSVLPLQLDSDVVYLLKVPGVFNERQGHLSFLSTSRLVIAASGSP
jgi:hypothetical protein